MQETGRATEEGLDGNVPDEFEIEIADGGEGALQRRQRKTTTGRALVLAESWDGAYKSQHKINKSNVIPRDSPTTMFTEPVRVHVSTITGQIEDNLESRAVWYGTGDEVSMGKCM